MKKILPALILVSFLASPAIGLAVEVVKEKPAPTIKLEEAIPKIGNWIFTLLLAFAAIFIIIAAIQFVTAGGNPESVKQARDKVLYAAIGILVALLAKGLVAFIERTIK